MIEQVPFLRYDHVTAVTQPREFAPVSRGAFCNQLRQKIGVVYGNPETTTGGNALKFYCSVRLDIRRKKPIKRGDETIGSECKVKVVKNKLAPLPARRRLAARPALRALRGGRAGHSPERRQPAPRHSAPELIGGLAGADSMRLRAGMPRGYRAASL
jgi:hypothetical protein